MYGAILGDIIGSPFEFDRGDKTKAFELFTEGCDFTDDSVMTLAVAAALMEAGPDANEEYIKETLIYSMQEWGRDYPYAGYGGGFRRWLKSSNPKPYNSWGNGSAMRVSAAGWLYPTLERTREVAKYTAEVTHNHPEGVKGAEATASCIFLARNGATKEAIKKYVEDEFGYDLDRTLDSIRPTYHHVESCQETVPEAIIAFLEAEDFEDAIRNAVSLGGDTDTLGAITGSIAEAYYDMSAIMRAECRNRIDDKDNFIFFVTMLCSRMRMEGHVLVPFVTVNEDAFSGLDIENIKEGDTFRLNEDVRLRMDTVSEGKDEEWFCLFTSEELRKQQTGNVIMSLPISEMLETSVRSERVKGVVINPFGKFVRLDKDILKVILQEYNDNWKGVED